MTVNKGATARFEVSYRNGKWFRIEQKSGKLNAAQHQNIMAIIPKLEADIATTVIQFEGRIAYQAIKKPSKTSLHNHIIGTYKAFYQKRRSRTPKINGNAAKEICNYLRSISDSDEKALEIWQNLLNKWDNVEPFYRSKMDLSQINYSLNTLLDQVDTDDNEDQINKFQDFLQNR